MYKTKMTTTGLFEPEEMTDFFLFLTATNKQTLNYKHLKANIFCKHGLYTWKL